MLRSDLLWSRIVRTYLLGEREPRSDLMAWNTDATRMPYKMHSDYLRGFFLNNDLTEGRFFVDGKPVAVAGITAPIFSVGTETDHIAPWHSVYKIHLLNQGDITFVLASGGHNAGIVSEPEHPNRHCKLAHRMAGGSYLSPEHWEAAACEKTGSWWSQWVRWLKDHSGEPISPPPIGHLGTVRLSEAPGTFVFRS